MIAYTLSPPFIPEGWTRKACDLEMCADAGAKRLFFECPPWSETIIERSLLRRPEVLARAIGLPLPHQLLVLHQVDRIDLYLRAERGLHLFEVKRPSRNTQWRQAADQIAESWARTSIWIRQGDEPVFLWAMVPVRWSQKSGEAKIPPSWEADLADIKRRHLAGWPAVSLGLLFYAIFQSDGGRVFFLWRAGETPPPVTAPNGGAADGRPNKRLQPSAAGAIMSRRG